MTDMYVKVPFQKVAGIDAVTVPTYREGDVGFDIYAIDRVIIGPNKCEKVQTGIRVAGPVSVSCGGLVDIDTSKFNTLPTTYFFKIEGRSGMASRGVWPVGGIIDPSYRGEIIGIMFNSNSFSIEIEAGEKFAQMVMYSAIMHRGDFSVRFEEVLDGGIEATVRGDSGFGSTGA